jgi:WD40 repeat protein
MAENFEKPTLAWSLVFECPGAWPTAVALLDGGNRVAAADRSGAIYLWNVGQPDTEPRDDKKPPPKKEGEPIGPDRVPYRRLDGHTNAVTRLVSLPDGKTLASAGLDRVVRLWDTQAAASGTAEVIVDAETRAREAKISEKKDTPAPPPIKVETQGELAALSGHAEWINALAVSRNGKRLISGDDAAAVIVWDVAERKPVSRWTGRPGNWAASVALDGEGTLAFVGEFCAPRGDYDRPPPELRLYNAADGQLKIDVLAVQTPDVKKRDNSYGYFSAWSKFAPRGIVASDFSPDGKLVALGQGGETDMGKIHLIDTAAGKLVRTIGGHQYGVTDLLFTKDGKNVVSAGRDTTVRVTRVDDGKEVAAIGKPRGGQFKDWITALALSPDERTLAAADMGGLVHVWKFG